MQYVPVIIVFLEIIISMVTPVITLFYRLVTSQLMPFLRLAFLILYNSSIFKFFCYSLAFAMTLTFCCCVMFTVNDSEITDYEHLFQTT